MCDQRNNELIAYVDGTLNAGERRAMEAHLVFCSTCSERLGVLENESSLMRSSFRELSLPKPSVSTEHLIEQLRRPASSRLNRAAQRYREWREKARIERIPGPFEVGAAGMRKLERALSALGEFKLIVAAGASICGLILVTAMVCRIFESKKSYDGDAHLALHKQERELQKLRTAQDEANESIHELTLQLERERLRAEQRVNEVLRANQNTNAERDKLAEALKGQREDARKLANQLRTLGESKMVDSNGDPVNTLRLTTDRGIEVTWDMPQQFLTPAAVKLGKFNNIGWMVRLNQSIAHFVSVPRDDEHLNDTSRTRRQWNQLMATQPVANCGTFAAPAAADGKIILGDGFSGTHLVALFQDTGQQVWTMNANDNGCGSLALSEDSSVCTFTSESCTLYAADTKTGKKMWSIYLSDPILSHPAVAKDRVLVVHGNAGKVKTSGSGPFALTCLGLKDGQPIWSVAVDGDAITSPVVWNNSVYLTTSKGTVSVHSISDGTAQWERNVCATCAPVIRNGDVYVSSWVKDPKFGFSESLIAMKTKGTAEVYERLAGPYPANYLLPLSSSDSVLKTLQEGAFEEDFESELAKALVKGPLPATPAVACNWNAYGPRPVVSGNDAFATIGDHIVCADIRDGRPKWADRIIGHADDAFSIGSGQPPLTPPAFANGKLYVGSAWGDVLCIDAGTGTLLWRYRLPHSNGISSEIVLDKGRAFAVTKSGLLFGLDTGDLNATGWTMAGGSPSRNGAVSVKN